MQDTKEFDKDKFLKNWIEILEMKNSIS
jgi:hypothetical protein